MDSLNDQAAQCNLLKAPLSVSDLVGSGAHFEINTDFDDAISTEMFDEFNTGSDNEDADGNKGRYESLVSPWTKSFAELRTQMTRLSEHIYKATTKAGAGDEEPVPLNARVCIRYNAYWEGESAPFDSTYLRDSSATFYTGRSEVLEGIEAAVRTMRRGEHAQFVIAHQLLFRELGCPPRVKPRADGLYIIELVSYNVVGDIDATNDLSEEDRTKFAIVADKVKQIHLKGMDFFQQGMYRNACRAFEKATDALNFCSLANEEEEREQVEFLLKLYTNLAVCYNRINVPKRTCLMCNEIRRLTHNKPSCKALFQEGRALLKLGEYERARSLLTRASNMEPQNVDINKELKELELRYARYKQHEKNIWTKAMGIVKEQEPPASAPNQKDSEKEFEKEISDLMKSFKEDLTIRHLVLTNGLTEKEISTVDALASQMGLLLNKSHNQSSLMLKKKELPHKGLTT